MSECTCKADIEAKFLERFKEQQPEATDHGVELAGYGLCVVGNALKAFPCMPVRLSALHPLKKGGTKLKKSESSMFFSYCPFCGIKLGPLK